MNAAQMLNGFLTEENMTQKALAVRLGCQPSEVNEMVKGKRKITARTAVKLEYVTAIDAWDWIRPDWHGPYL
jgi:plasmid maintenance system antidote protein VapI